MTQLETEKEEIWQARIASQRADGYLAEASGLSVESAEDMAVAAELRETIRQADKEAEAERENMKRPVLDEGRRIDGAFAPAKKVFADALGLVDRAIRQYREREEAKRRAAEIEARRLAEIERQKLFKAAQKAETRGLTETADRLERQAEMVPTPMVESRAVKPAGFVARKVWKFEVFDKAALVRAIAADPKLLGLVQVDEAAVRRMVIALRTGNPIPGVRAWEGEDYSSGGRRS